MDNPELLSIFTTIAGFIVGLGSVTVIDIHGALGRTSGYWRAAAVRTHKVTKPLIWIGITLVGLGYLLSSSYYLYTPWLWGVYAVLVVNGSFLSFVISPKLLANEKAKKPEEQLPTVWQICVIVSAIISFCGWWSSLLIYLHVLLN